MFNILLINPWFFPAISLRAPQHGGEIGTSNEVLEMAAPASCQPEQRIVDLREMAGIIEDPHDDIYPHCTR